MSPSSVYLTANAVKAPSCGSKAATRLKTSKKARRVEAENAAKALDVHDIKFMDLGDYPLDMTRDDKFELVDIIRDVQPNFMMSHSQYDPYNTDHSYATSVTMECRMIAQAWGHNPDEKVLGAPQLYLFEPHQPEQMLWKPNVFLDISEVWEKKRAAIECMQGQEHLWNFYTNVAEKPRQSFPAQFRRHGRWYPRKIRRRLSGNLPPKQ